MFRCEDCGRVTAPREKCFVTPVEFRTHRFPFRAEANAYRREDKIEYRDDPGGEGQQIVRETKLCKDCVSKA